MLAVGDSVMLRASRTLRPALGRGAVVDAAVSRRFTAGADAVVSRLSSLKPRTVVIHLGNNDHVRLQDLATLLDRLKGVPRVVLVNVHLPLQWEKSVNDVLEYADSHWENVVLVDWSGITDRQPQKSPGAVGVQAARVYARAIAEAVRAPAEPR